VRISVKLDRRGPRPKEVSESFVRRWRKLMVFIGRSLWAPAARRRCPVVSGKLRKSITWRFVERAKGLAFCTVFGRARSRAGYPYGLAVEFGTRAIRVGRPSRPRKRWAAKTRRGGGRTGTTMPFVRAAWALDIQKRARLLLRKLVRRA